MSAFLDLNVDSVKEYLLTKSDFFAPDARLSVYEIGESEEDGDGFINFLYRVWDENGKSVIVKQAKTYYKAFDEGVGPFVVHRNALEADVMRIKGAIVPEYIPQIYQVDLENNIYLAEDCGDLAIMRFELMKGKTFPRFPRMIGEYLAKTNFYTSEFYLDATDYKELQCRFMNPQMRLVFEVGLFLKDEQVIESEPDPHADPERVAMGEAPWQDKAFREEMLKLRYLHMKKDECLVHGDLHTSNIMIAGDKLKVIDSEYSYMGPFSADMGYLMGSVLYEYLRWFYMDGYDPGFCENFRETMLSYMVEMVRVYEEVFIQCWQADAKETYKNYEGFRDWIFKDFIHEVAGYTGTQIISRVGNIVPLPDFDSIPDKAARNDACRLALNIARYLIMHRDEFSGIEEMVNTIVTLTKNYQRLIKII